MRWGSTGGLFEESGITLEKVDMEEEVEGEGPEVEERGQESPVL